MNTDRNRPLIFDFVESLTAALKKPGNIFDVACRDITGRSPLVVTGNWFGAEGLITERHAPFVAVWPGESPVEIELRRNNRIAVAPRSFDIRLSVGFDVGNGGPLPPPPEPCPDAAEPVEYNAQIGRPAESAALAAVTVATELFSEYSFTPTAATAVYTGTADWPLEVYEFVISFGAVRTVQTGV